MEKIIQIKKEIDCSLHNAFKTFIDHNLLETWLTEKAEVEPKIGGKYELFWDPNDRENNSTIGCKVTAIAPNRLLAFEWKGPIEFKELMNGVDPLTHVVVLFVNCTEGSTLCTEVHLVHSGWRISEAWKEARNYFEKAWKIAFKKLEMVITDRNQT